MKNKAGRKTLCKKDRNFVARITESRQKDMNMITSLVPGYSWSEEVDKFLASKINEIKIALEIHENKEMVAQ